MSRLIRAVRGDRWGDGVVGKGTDNRDMFCCRIKKYISNPDAQGVSTERCGSTFGRPGGIKMFSRLVVG